LPPELFPPGKNDDFEVLESFSADSVFISLPEPSIGPLRN
jgi:hypothetical protein